ncbi:hypothetical protein B0H13DRAFT_1852396 [Mycena leptocephala]|nr:hypothetical protein B0H13DRAFT_1852396 [Mycena leptocephala]
MAMTKPGLGGRPLTGGKAPRKTVSGKTVAGKFTTAKRSTGAPAPRLALGSNVTVPSTSAPLSAAVPFRTNGNLPKQIRLAGADWEILGRGVFDERLNGAGDGYCLVCRDGGKIFLCSVGVDQSPSLADRLASPFVGLASPFARLAEKRAYYVQLLK